MLQTGSYVVGTSLRRTPEAHLDVTSETVGSMKVMVVRTFMRQLLLRGDILTPIGGNA